MFDAAHRYSQTIYLLTSTCKIGTDDMALVDPRLKVHGLERLSVVDYSFMPQIVFGNTNAPAIMIADMIREEARRN